MGNWELLIIAFGLSMDAAAVSVCRGMALKKVRWKDMAVPGLCFGAFQAFMPFLGYWFGMQFKASLAAVDHWIAFLLLSVIGVNMIRESEEGAEYPSLSFRWKDLMLLSLATSIDALAIGVTFAFLHAPLLRGMVIIGLTTLIFSMMGVKVGSIFGYRLKSHAELAGGAVLIILGIKILFEHVGIL